MGHVQTSYLIPAARERVFAYIRDLDFLQQDLAPAIDLQFSQTTVGEEQRTPEVKVHSEILLAVKRFGVTVKGLVRVERCTEVIDAGQLDPSHAADSAVRSGPNAAPAANFELIYSQESGWFRSWRHAITLAEHSDGVNPTTLVSDSIDYRLPLGMLGTLADDLFLKRDLQRILRRRAAQMALHFEALPLSAHSVSATATSAQAASGTALRQASAGVNFV